MNKMSSAEKKARTVAPSVPASQRKAVLAPRAAPGLGAQ